MEKPIPVKFDRSDVLLDYNYDQGNVFYLGYENDPTRQVSILFKDLEWLKKVHGADLENMNEGRINEIEALEQCLKYNVPRFELATIKNCKKVDGKFYRYSKDEEDQEYYAQRLDERGRANFQKNIDYGMYILCRLV